MFTLIPNILKHIDIFRCIEVIKNVFCLTWVIKNVFCFIGVIKYVFRFDCVAKVFPTDPRCEYPSEFSTTSMILHQRWMQLGFWNLWGVCEVGDGATAFDQNIGYWDVSNGQDFVSEIKYEQNKIDHTSFMTVLLIVNSIHHLSHKHHHCLLSILFVIIFTCISITE